MVKEESDSNESGYKKNVAKTDDMENIKGYTRLQNDYIKEQINTNPELKDLPELQKRKIAAWQVANSNMMPAQSDLKQDLYETPAMRAARSRSSSTGGTVKEAPELDIEPAHLPILAALNATDVLASIAPPTIDNDGSQRFDFNSQFPNNEFVVRTEKVPNRRTGKLEEVKEFGNVVMKAFPNGERMLIVYDSQRHPTSFKIVNNKGEVDNQSVKKFANTYMQLNGSNATKFMQRLNKTRPHAATQ